MQRASYFALATTREGIVIFCVSLSGTSQLGKGGRNLWRQSPPFLRRKFANAQVIPHDCLFQELGDLHGIDTDVPLIMSRIFSSHNHVAYSCIRIRVWPLSSDFNELFPVVWLSLNRPYLLNDPSGRSRQFHHVYAEI